MISVCQYNLRIIFFQRNYQFFFLLQIIDFISIYNNPDLQKI